MIRVLVVEDQRALADALSIGITAQDDLECVGAVRTVDEAVLAVEARSPDVVLMDIHLPGVDGVEGTRRVKAAHPRTRVLILTADATTDLLARAAAAGAAGFLAKDSTFTQILSAIRSPIEDQMLVERTTLASLMAGQRVAPLSAAAARAADQAGLTSRELAVLALMGDGLDPAAIAERLVVSIHTARSHVKRVMMKLGAHSQLEAVVIARRLGLLVDGAGRS